MENKTTRRTALKQKIKDLDRAAIAYSGGVDSTLLLKISSDILGEKNVLAIIVKTELFPEHDFRTALKTLNQLECRFIIIERSVLEIKEVFQNPEDRCYRCKKEIFSTIIDEAKIHKFKNVLDGTNYDDIKAGHRPGVKALEELCIISPFAEFKIRKEEIRSWAKELGLGCWDRPSASCLATRIPYNVQLTGDRLRLIENAEDILRNLSFKHCRVRIHGDIARIEINEEDFKKILDGKTRRIVIRRFKELGFLYISLDIEGYRSGSMDI
jgi:uncharacterized protein